MHIARFSSSSCVSAALSLSGARTTWMGRCMHYCVVVNAPSHGTDKPQADEQDKPRDERHHGLVSFLIDRHRKHWILLFHCQLPQRLHHRRHRLHLVAPGLRRTRRCLRQRLLAGVLALNAGTADCALIASGVRVVPVVAASAAVKAAYRRGVQENGRVC